VEIVCEKKSMRTKLCLVVAADSRKENTIEVSVLYVTL
jgi:hypothetical protein